jgi:hypothetical protein
MNKEFCSKGFREYVDKIMGDTKAVQPPTYKSIWAAAMAEEMAAAV